MSTISASTTSATAYKVSADTTGTLVLQTGSTPTTAVTIDTSQNMGLGVTPSAWGGTSKALQFSTGGFEARSAGFSMNANAYFSSGWKYVGADYATLYNQSSGQHQWYTAASGSANGAISFTQAMTLDASGNLALGTTSAMGTTSNRTVFTVNGTNDSLITMGVGGTRKGTFYHDGTNMAVGNDASGYLGFSNNGSERARIDSSGNLLVGTTSLVSAGKIEVAATAASNQGLNIKDTGANNLTYIGFFNSSGSVAGTITHTGSTTVAYNTSSDYRLKENIAPMAGALAKVAALKPVTYTWKEDGTAGQGFIAHELQEVVPDCVTGEKDAVDANGNPVYQGIDVSFLVATLTAAIQEQQAIIETLTNRIQALENK